MADCYLVFNSLKLLLSVL